MVSLLRKYLGPLVFIVYLANWIGFGFILISRSLSTLDPLTMTKIGIVLFIASTAILLILYRRLSSLQKEFFQISGEIFALFSLCIIVNYVLSSRIHQVGSFEPFFFVLFTLALLAYHLVVNRRTIEDLGIKSLGKDVEYTVVALIIVFCLFLWLQFGSLLEGITLGFPSFDEIVLVVLVVFSEEIASRYYIQRKAEEVTGQRYGILIAAVLFSLLHLTATHFDLQSFVVLIGKGLIFGYGYSRNKNLAVPLLLHVVDSLLPIVFF
ncbi:MAG: CPBP family intramembrane metalloprotease [Theionarchaea archaeon]|nr:CPBP family intramembrane metalloprotease [Theionarchaea archaeon]MBU7001729.1 CPBP family intramembrane metalloprotease [Theionarchaea archaeon]MBU7021044.1 CPBP family intramembrane metalloprotease [Theionarchaea archaeon]MBU7036263.1 CPBP family intramembrane metalloprotease [Theionarchaea archaeon]MBU7041905.1 CPBP family intramembrane metalloprotease [Theionarchaea archaeon]